MESVFLDVSGLSTSYKKFVVSNVSFKLSNGDILGLVGRSGSGKSTLIKTLIGLKRKNSGTAVVYVNSKKTSLLKVLGYSPQDNAIYPSLTVEENITTFARLHNMKKKDYQKQMNKILSRLDLQNSRKKRINELSGGMQKRADLAVTLIHNPKVLILDEPFTGLDISLQDFIWDFIRELSKEGKIIIVSSHNLSNLQKNCSRFGLIEGGLYYDNEKIMDYMKKSKDDLTQFLEKLFTRDLLSEK